MVAGLCSFIWNISRTKNINSMEDKMNLIFEIVSCNIIYFTFNFYFLAKRYRKYTETLFLLVSSRQDYGIQSLLEEQETMKMCKFIRFYKYCFLVQTGLKVSIALKEMDSFKIFLDKIGTALSFASGYYLVAQILLLFMIYNVIVQSFHDCVRHTLTNISNNNQVLVEKIRLFRLFYLAVCGTYKNHIFCFGNLFYYILLFLTSVSIGVVSYGALTDLMTKFTMSSILIIMDAGLTLVWYWYTFSIFCGYTEKLTQSVRYNYVSYIANNL